MDAMKEALKNRRGKGLNISVMMEHPEEDSGNDHTDLAPPVHEDEAEDRALMKKEIDKVGEPKGRMMAKDGNAGIGGEPEGEEDLKALANKKEHNHDLYTGLHEKNRVGGHADLPEGHDSSKPQHDEMEYSHAQHPLNKGLHEDKKVGGHSEMEEGHDAMLSHIKGQMSDEDMSDMMARGKPRSLGERAAMHHMKGKYAQK